ncbi:MAG: ABC transporter permease [Leadbetterella sp.]|nr:ABC transporter permease [Leadbetterella sp.]
MIRQYFKLLWKKRKQNAFLILQFILVFWVIFATFSYGIVKVRSYRTPLGFEWKDVYRVNLNWDRSQDSLVLKNNIFSLKKELESFPEISAVSYSGYIAPYLGSMWMNGGQNEEESISFQTHFLSGDEDYARVWGIRIKEGRFFTKEDKEGKYFPMVVNEKFVRDFMKGKPPVGFIFNYMGREARITGVVENFKYQGDFSDESPFTFVPVRKWDESRMLNFKVAKGTGPDIQKKVSDLVESVTKNSDFEIVKVEEQRAFRNNLTLIPLGILGFLALFLIMNIILGLFGILRYNIARRIPEIGLRKAVGATSGAIRRQFTGEMMALTFVAFLIAVIFAVQIPFVTPLPIEKGAYFTGIGLGALLIFGLVYLCTLAPSQQAAQTLPARALHEE